MLRAIGVIIFGVVAYTGLMLAAGSWPPSYAAAAAFLVSLIGFAALAWWFAPERNRGR